ncbi:MAG: 3-dehydroquinate synthase [Anaeroplasmataceae bacterium]
MKTITLNTNNKPYDIIIQDNLILNIIDYIKPIYNGSKLYIVTDNLVEKLYLDKVVLILSKSYHCETIVFDSGEDNKTLDTYKSICEQLLEKDIRRENLLIALGGGVVGDITAFVASTIYRGINYINIPTTLLSQLDSSIGGKTGIDFYGRKNILGTFYQPSLVLIDPMFLTTLKKDEINNGLGELIKHYLIGDKTIFENYNNIISEEIIYKSLLVKKHYVENDVYDKSIRMILNFGHTFGHIIELKYNLSHGIAVINGMILAIKYGVDLKITNPKLLNELYSLLDFLNIEYNQYNYSDYFKDIIYDKKNLDGIINFILLKDINDPVIYKIIESQIKE